MTEGLKTTCGSRMLEKFVAPYSAFVVEQLASRGHGAGRQDQHGRVRDGLVERKFLFRPGQEPVARRLCGRRQLGRIGGGRRGALRSRGDRHRHRGIDSTAGGAVGRVRHQADLWRVLALRARRFRVEPRYARRLRPDGRRLRDAADRDGRPRCARLDQPRPAAGGLRARYRGGGGEQAARGPAHRLAARVRGRGDRRRGGAGDRDRARRIPPARRGHGRRESSQRPPVGPRLLRDRIRRSLVQPVALRRRALRASRGELRRPRRHVLQNPRRRLRRRGQAPHPGRHLRALARLLRRVLPEGAAGAPADRRRFPSRLRQLRPDRRTDVADGRIPARRKKRRSGQDVPERHFHHRRQPDRGAGDVDSLRFRRQRVCRSACRSRAITSPRRKSSTPRIAINRSPTGIAACRRSSRHEREGPPRARIRRPPAAPQRAARREVQ